MTELDKEKIKEHNEETTKINAFINRKEIKQQYSILNKKSYKPTFYETIDDYLPGGKLYKPKQSFRLDRMRELNNIKLRDATDYSDYTQKDYQTVIELSNYFTNEDIERITGLPSTIINKILERAGKEELPYYEKPPVIIWIPRFLFRFVDVINLKYDPMWIEEAKKVFFRTLKKIRSVAYKI